MPEYKRVRYTLVLELNKKKLDLGGLEWADITTSHDGLLWHFRDPGRNYSFKVLVSGRALNETPTGHETLGRDYTEEEVELGLLMAIKERIGQMIHDALEVSKSTGKRVDIPMEMEITATSQHLRMGVKMVNAPTKFDA